MHRDAPAYEGDAHALIDLTLAAGDTLGRGGMLSLSLQHIL